MLLYYKINIRNHTLKLSYKISTLQLHQLLSYTQSRRQPLHVFHLTKDPRVDKQRQTLFPPPPVTPTSHFTSLYTSSSSSFFFFTISAHTASSATAPARYNAARGVTCARVPPRRKKRHAGEIADISARAHRLTVYS